VPVPDITDSPIKLTIFPVLTAIVPLLPVENVPLTVMNCSLLTPGMSVSKRVDASVAGL